MPLTRRRFLASSTLGVATAAAGSLPFAGVASAGPALSAGARANVEALVETLGHLPTLVQPAEARTSGELLARSFSGQDRDWCASVQNLLHDLDGSRSAGWFAAQPEAKRLDVLRRRLQDARTPEGGVSVAGRTAAVICLAASRFYPEGGAAAVPTLVALT
jgi:hypothetical protein